jgi:hypothetical protein
VTTIDDKRVEAAARELWEQDQLRRSELKWADDANLADRDMYRRTARRVLEAAERADA